MTIRQTGWPQARPGQAVGLLGGSFDPAHDGHVHITREALKRFALDRVWWLVSPQNPIKNRRAEAYAERFEQVRTRVSLPGMVTSDIELRWRVQHTKALLDELKKAPSEQSLRLVDGG